MKNIKSLIWILPLALGLAACNSDEEEQTGTPKQVNVQVYTGETQNISLTAAILQGHVEAPASSYTEIGIAYYPDKDNSKQEYAKATDIDNNYSNNHSFTVSISGLSPDAKYTYFAYAKDINGKLINATERKTFQTVSPEELLESTSIRYVALREASLYWTIEDNKVFSEIVEKKVNASFGVAWSTQRNALTSTNMQIAANTQAIVFDNNSQRAIVQFLSLRPATTYYYTTYLNMNGKEYIAPVNSFATMAESAFNGTAPDNVQAVDMGLPSGTKWASMNVGAGKAEEAGLYFAWGETDGHNTDGSDVYIFGWDSYHWCNGSRDTQTKYCTNGGFGTVDNKSILDLADDAAYINWGEEWRMPTSEDMDELIDNTISEWTTQENVDGYKFTSISTRNSIFLPAAGCRVSESHYEDGTDCYYWSATVDSSKPYGSRYLRFYVGKVFLGSMFRYYGMNVRPVYRK